jgi:GlpG protein
MRQIGNLPDVEQAMTLADYLLSLKIETRLEQEPDGRWAVWVCDEDRLVRARDELAAFRNAPTDARFLEGARAERARRQATPPAEEAEAPAEPAAEPSRSLRSGTLGLVILTVVVGLVSLSESGSGFGRVTQLPPALRLTATDDPTLPEIRAGQLWRLVTPALLHLSFPHWLFNVLWLLDLGSQIEARRGLHRYLTLVVALAVVSNLAQFYLGHPDFQSGQLRLYVSANFGGLSGVVYGLFGYVWVKGRFEPELGLHVPPALAAVLLAWLLFCFTNLATVLVGPVGNAAHVAGLLLGLAIGVAPTLWRQVRGR